LSANNAPKRIIAEQGSNAFKVMCLPKRAARREPDCRKHLAVRRFWASGRRVNPRWPDIQARFCAGCGSVNPNNCAVDKRISEVSGTRHHLKNTRIYARKRRLRDDLLFGRFRADQPDAGSAGKNRAANRRKRRWAWIEDTEIAAKAMQESLERVQSSGNAAAFAGQGRASLFNSLCTHLKEPKSETEWSLYCIRQSRTDPDFMSFSRPASVG